jgi:hypothetical protein
MRPTKILAASEAMPAIAGLRVEGRRLVYLNENLTVDIIARTENSELKVDGELVLDRRE